MFYCKIGYYIFIYLVITAPAWTLLSGWGCYSRCHPCHNTRRILLLMQKKPVQIKPSNSLCVPPVVLITKKDVGPNFCVDYHIYWIASPRSTPFHFCALVTPWIWSKDSSGSHSHWQVQLSPIMKKTTCVTHLWLFQFMVKLFGLFNVQATFKQLISPVLCWLQCVRLVWCVFQRLLNWLVWSRGKVPDFNPLI
jgi:hypothetical protein